MHVTPADRTSEIEGLPLRREVKDLFLAKLETGPFGEYFNSPRNFYSQGWPEQPGNWPEFEGRRLLPLWEHHERVFAIDIAEGKGELISFDVESPAEYRIEKSVDSTIFKMIELHVWEYGGEAEEASAALEFARKVSLPDLDRLKDILERFEECSGEEIAAYGQSLS